ncbi:MAG: AlgW protein [Betaproteobacteria bacterium]|nr:MAG: AlgW protein [Betaproteobacteria bacterium]
MNGSLRLAVQLTLAAAAGGLFAVALLHGPPARDAGAPTIAAAAATDSATAARSAPAVAAVPASQAPSSNAPPASYRDAVAHAGPSVVTVHSAQLLKRPLPIPSTVLVKGLGSGVIVDRDGFVVTNHHVVKDATELAVALPDGSLHLARIVGADPESDISLLRIEAQGLRPIEFADVNDVAVGDIALAVGNPLGVGQTVTQGIISAIVRTGSTPVENFIQTDAAINPGNSGGALVDTTGRLVGINTAILSHSGGSEGIGFAIPGDLVRAVAATLRAKGRVARAWIGLHTAAAPQPPGALVVAVDPEGPAHRAGIVAGDVILRIGARNVLHPQDARAVLLDTEPGADVRVVIVRNGEHTTVNVQAGPVPVQRASGGR